MWESDEDYDINDFYEYVKDPKGKDDEGAVKIISGPFDGMIYKYNNFKFSKPENKDEIPNMEYEFTVLHIPEEIIGVEYPDEMKESFDQLLAKILMNIVMNKIDDNKREEYDNANGEGDIDESFERRVVYKWDDPVSAE